MENNFKNTEQMGLSFISNPNMNGPICDYFTTLIKVFCHIGKWLIKKS